MPLKTDPIEEPALNLTPMVDVVLNLVMFFLVSTEFATDASKEGQLPVHLPVVKEAAPLTDLPDELVLLVQEDGTILHVKQNEPLITDELTIDELKLRLAEAARIQRGVVVRGDRDGKYQYVMTVLNLCNRAGLNPVLLTNEIDSSAR